MLEGGGTSKGAYLIVRWNFRGWTVVVKAMDNYHQVVCVTAEDARRGLGNADVLVLFMDREALLP